MYKINNETKEMLLNKLHAVEAVLTVNKKYKSYNKEDYKPCTICGEKDVGTRLFCLKTNLCWEDSLRHYISVHDTKLSEELIDAVFRYKVKKPVVHRLKGSKFTKYNTKYIKIDRNQLLILDSLMIHGSEKIYKDKKKNLFRYSEHAGLLDFNEHDLFRVIVYGNTQRVDKSDDDIFLPGELDDAPDYEYIFHTHPATPKPGGRVNVGILYEFPSAGDIFNFIENHNEGLTQGSCVICAEGLYIIKQLRHSFKKIKINDNKLYKMYNATVESVQLDAIDKYGYKFTNSVFYSEIAQNKSYINKLNDTLKQFGLKIDYYPRVQDEKKRWVLDTVYLPITPID